MTLTDDFEGVQLNLNGKPVDKISDRINTVVSTIKEIAEGQSRKSRKVDSKPVQGP